MDLDRQDVVVEALLEQADDLGLRGDLSTLQTFEAEQRDGGNREHLHTQMDVQNHTQNNHRQSAGAWRLLTMGTSFTERMEQLAEQPMLVKLG